MIAAARRRRLSILAFIQSIYVLTQRCVTAFGDGTNAHTGSVSFTRKKRDQYCTV